ncbi:M23 family metallopeptidase [Parvularcula oceani]|uniref:M23 family metallopeptidase n=1 Tax=Parvularcula oceani TaxID=1247963 RepID=UPI00069022AD|nr:M23 family metallopeptidase [Parvularcula oceani]
MRRIATTAAILAMSACAANAQPPEPSLSPSKGAGIAGEAPEDARTTFTEDSRFTQGGLAFGQTEPGTAVALDGEAVPVTQDGRFVLGFGRDEDTEARLRLAYSDGNVEERSLRISDRSFPESRIEGVPSNTVNPYSEEDLEHIAVSTDKKTRARERWSPDPMWTSGFTWPARGRISGVFGSQRFYNGEARRPHSGLDIAAPDGTTPMQFVGTDIAAPADGVVTLAEPDMFFEGGLVLIDHGQNLESALMHMSRVDVQAGQRVQKGDVIGGVGMTGRATGPHVHWSLKWRDRLVDPLLLVENEK